LPRRDVLPVELGRDSTWSPLWSFERPYIIVVYVVDIYPLVEL